ncbi:MAG: hypothetical protein G01um10143_598 [Parcubacteria group bacterium Gr01-1014_3]|nr:MAG: hypothetical protein G01um10143_598 [Parcubacteria group bacterium Gr01-1014_3]
MVNDYSGHYSYNDDTVRNLNSYHIGVYYCGLITTDGGLIPLYIGRAVSEDGIRGRLLDHLRGDYWPGVTHFGYHLCDNAQEAEDFEASEISRYKPKYNKLGK